MMDREWVRAAKGSFNTGSRMTANFQGWLFFPAGHKAVVRIDHAHGDLDQLHIDADGPFWGYRNGYAVDVSRRRSDHRRFRSIVRLSGKQRHARKQDCKEYREANAAIANHRIPRYF